MRILMGIKLYFSKGGKEKQLVWRRNIRNKKTSVTFYSANAFNQPFERNFTCSGKLTMCVLSSVRM
jgi:hypothetical protein